MITPHSAVWITCSTRSTNTTPTRIPESGHNLKHKCQRRVRTFHPTCQHARINMQYIKLYELDTIYDFYKMEST